MAISSGRRGYWGGGCGGKDEKLMNENEVMRNTESQKSEAVVLMSIYLLTQLLKGPYKKRHKKKGELLSKFLRETGKSVHI